MLTFTIVLGLAAIFIILSPTKKSWDGSSLKFPDNGPNADRNHYEDMNG